MADDLAPVGVALVAENEQQFTRAIGRASASLGVLDRAANVAARGMSALDQVVIGGLRRLGELGVNSFLRAGQAATRYATDVLEAAAKTSSLGATMERIRPSLVQVASVSFAPLFDQLDQMVQKAAPAALGVVSALSTHLGGLAQNALTWGSNVVSQFAQGMFNAAVQVLDALTFLGNLISGWLQPGSPPKLLPDLDKWGTEAAEVWLSGWAKADFSNFKNLAGPLESLIRSTATPGGKDTGIIPRILGAREGVAQAIQELRSAGKVSEATLNSIIGSVGTADASVRALIESFVAMSAANEEVAQAQNALNAATAKYDELLKPVNAQLASLDEAAQRLAEDQQKRMLELILADPNATQAEKARARIEIERIGAERNRRALLAEQAVAVENAQTKLDAAEQAAATATAEFDARQQQVQLLAEENSYLLEQATLLERINQAMASIAAPKGGAAGGAAKPKLFEVDTTAIDNLMTKLQELKDKLGPLETAWSTAWQHIETAMQPAVDAWNTHVVPGLEALKQSFLDSMPAMTTSVGDMVGFTVQQLGIVLPGVFTQLGRSLTSLAHIWDTTHAGILATVSAAWGAIVTVVSSGIMGAMTIITVVLRIIEGIIDGFILLTEGDFAGWAANVETVWTDVFEILKTAAETNLALVTGYFQEHFPGLVKFVEDLLAAITKLWDYILGLDIGGLAIANGTVPPPVTPGTSNGTSHPVSGPSNISPNITNTNSSNVYNYAPTYGAAPANPSTDFALMSVWAR